LDEYFKEIFENGNEKSTVLLITESRDTNPSVSHSNEVDSTSSRVAQRLSFVELELPRSTAEEEWNKEQFPSTGNTLIPI